MASDDAIGASLDASELRAYVEKHNLENFVSRAVNSVLSTKPADPWGALAAKLGLFCVTKPSFKCLAPYVVDDQFFITVTSQVRGASVRVHEFSIPVYVAEEVELDFQATYQFAFTLSDSLSGLEVHQIAQWIDVVRRCVLEHGPWPVDMQPDVVHHLACNLLQSAGVISDRSPLGMLQDDLSAHKVQPSPILESSDDMDVWDENGWVQLCFTVMQGGDASPVSSPVSVALVTDLGAYARLEGSEIRDQEIRLEFMEEFCPALNCLGLCGKFADSVTQKIAADRKIEWPGPVMNFADPLKASLQKIFSAVESIGAGPDHIGVIVQAGGRLCYDAESSTYQFDSDKKIESADIVSYWVELCSAFDSGFIRALVSPLEPSDSEGYSCLRDQLPGVDILVEERDLRTVDNSINIADVQLGLSASSADGYDVIQDSVMVRGDYTRMAWIFDDNALGFQMSLDFAMSFAKMRYLVLPSLKPSELESLNSRMFELIMRAANNRTEQVDSEDFGIPKKLFIDGSLDLKMSSTADEAGLLYAFVDENQTGKVTEEEWSVFEHVTSVADEDMLTDLNEFLMGTATRGRRYSCYNVFDAMTSSGGSLTHSKFQAYLRQHGFRSANISKMYWIALDSDHDHLIEWKNFCMLHIICSLHAFERVARCQQFLCELCERRSQTVLECLTQDSVGSNTFSLTEFVHRMRSIGYSGTDMDLHAGFRFLDRDGSGVLSCVDIESLMIFQTDDVVRDMVAFIDHLANLFGSIDNAFKGFCESIGVTSPSMSLDEFVEAYKLSGFRGEVDPRVWFQFLNINQSGSVSERDFDAWRYFGGVDVWRQKFERNRRCIERCADIINGQESVLQSFCMLQAATGVISLSKARRVARSKAPVEN